MPSITLTPGSSASSIISLTFNAGASLGNISFNAGPIVFPFDDPYSYIIQTAGGTYYWATSGGISENIEALNPGGDPITSADKDMVTYSVRGLVLADFIQAGFNYLLDKGSGNYNWSNSSGIEEDPPVSATSVDELTNTAGRVGEIFNYVYIIT